MKNIFIIGLLLGALVSCSKSKDGGGIPGSGLPELTDTQKQKVTNINTSMEDLSVITEEKSSASSSALSPLVKVSRKELSKTQQELAQKMDWAETYSYCVSNLQASGGQDGVSPSLINFEIVGSQCPISYTSKSKTTQSMSDASGNVAIEQAEKFFVNPQGVLDLGLDISAYTSVTKASMTYSGGQSGVNLAMNMTGKMTADSKQYGNVISDFSGQMSVNMAADAYGSVTSQRFNLAMTVSQTYPDFKVIAYVVSSGSSNGAQVTENTSYYINGKQVSAEEFISIMGEIEMNSDIESFFN